MTITVEHAGDASEVLAVAEGYLSGRPIEHNLMLTLLNERAAHPIPGRYWIARDATEVCGVAFQSPLDFAAVLTPMAAPSARAIVDAIAGGGVELPGVSSEAATAAAFAGHWSEVCRSSAHPVAGQRLYHLRQLRFPPISSGRPRQATEDDTDVVANFVGEFHDFIGEPRPRADVLSRRVKDGQAWLWEDGIPVCIALHSAPVAGVTRIQTVYTPEAMRRRGYASACVADLSQRLVDAGHECVLYTDLGNPTSNSVYRRLGYEAVVEVLRYRFGKAPGT